ncbi:MAG: response regulator [Verrucomicrobiales bacterium]|nr:response regulator [Verrucomicrobiales bacterium]
MATKVLAIDDESGFTRLLKLNLEKNGEYEVRVENDSSLAQTAAREFKPDVILLDLVMPGLDGGDVSALFQGDPLLKDIPIIMLTALVSQGETSEDAVAIAGGRPVLPKPVKMETLTACIHEVLDAAAE